MIQQTVTLNLYNENDLAIIPFSLYYENDSTS